MIIKTRGKIREKLTASMTVVHKSTDGLHHKELVLTHPSKVLPGLVRPVFDGSSSMILDHQTFTIEAIDTLLFTSFPSEFVNTTLRMRLCERDVFHNGVLGEFIAAQEAYFRHYEYKHTVDGFCLCPTIDPLQPFCLTLHHVPKEPFTIQVVMSGNVLNPVP